MASYIALVRKDRDSDYGLEFPDFPGCISAGPTLEDIRALGTEALTLHLAGMMQDGEPLPEPSSLDVIMADPLNADALAMLVDVATRPSPSVRVNVILPQDLLARIDRATGNRSRFLADAARAKLAAANSRTP